MKYLEVSGAVRPIYGSLGVKRLRLLVVCKRLLVYVHRFLILKSDMIA